MGGFQSIFTSCLITTPWEKGRNKIVGVMQIQMWFKLDYCKDLQYSSILVLHNLLLLRLWLWCHDNPTDAWLPCEHILDGNARMPLDHLNYHHNEYIEYMYVYISKMDIANQNTRRKTLLIPMIRVRQASWKPILHVFALPWSSGSVKQVSFFAKPWGHVQQVTWSLDNFGAP